MKVETIEKIFNFLEENEGKEMPSKWNKLMLKYKLTQNLETHPDGSQYRYEGELNLSYSKITKLPNDLYVNGDLVLDGCQQLIKIPDDLYVEVDLALEHCQQLTELPDNLYVGGNLWLYYTKIEEIPDNLYVGGVLHIRDTPLANKYTNEEIIDIVTSTGGEIIGGILR
jgi:hypothetical protein